MQPDASASKRIVIIAADSSHAAAVRRVCGWWRYDVVWARELETASRLLAVPGTAVLIACQSAAGANWADALDLARNAFVPLIVVLPEFEARRWLELLRAGVGEVLSEPLTPPKIVRALENTIGFDSGGIISIGPLIEAGRRLLGI
jgi:DNA-binding NtrC family response regulator